MITTLIDKRDTSEILTEQIGMILINELANQRNLARAANRDLSLWDSNIYTERANIWEQVLNRSNDTPIVNVWFDSANFDQSSSNISERQKADGTFNIDVYGFGIASDTSEGHQPGDELAAQEAMRVTRLVRNILMAASNTYLQMSGVVWQRWIQTITKFQPQLDNRAIQHVQACRLSLVVKYNEFSPQVQPSKICVLSLDVFRAEDGALLAEVDYNFED